MSVFSGIAFGFGVVRGIQLAALTVPWVLQKLRRPDANESERSLLLMIGSRSILLGLGLVTLGLMHRGEALGWVLVGDGLLQLFDAGHAIAQRKRKLAVLPAVLCVLDGLAGVTLIMG